MTCSASPDSQPCKTSSISCRNCHFSIRKVCSLCYCVWCYLSGIRVHVPTTQILEQCAHVVCFFKNKIETCYVDTAIAQASAQHRAFHVLDWLSCYGWEEQREPQAQDVGYAHLLAVHPRASARRLYHDCSLSQARQFSRWSKFGSRVDTG